MFEVSFKWCSGELYKNKIEKFLYEIDEHMIPSLSSRVSILKYADKIAKCADTVFGYSDNLGEEVAACSVYCNNEIAFITSFAVKREYTNKHIGSILMNEVVRRCKERKCVEIQLEVYDENRYARMFYMNRGFIEIKSLERSKILQLVL
nr:GNAT family N-acetyltransferase [uncultured Cellulosilyticum sp.]